MSVDALENLKKAIVEYDSKRAASWARKAVQGKFRQMNSSSLYCVKGGKRLPAF